eukprot:gnl/TRDRNA2_/TRDRNA2_205017_c0_seq1.p1 gnl/TRDRNA2_/TRDRNA2_205017_c0~~gnl/TRDRNA2_/TRDRNA2_205017_c0_seq1.p1  ORF type:complete len:343 (+),score=53.78 gnl/TRDRNA2_/TRDRNA2_205017_c0_seq1:77-1030(+)
MAATGPVSAAEHKVRRAVQMAQFETDPENALPLWDDAVAEDGGSASSLGGRGLCQLRLREWASAATDLTAALEAPSQPTGDKRTDALQRSVLLDGLGLARLARGEFKDAVFAFTSALLELGQGNAVDAKVPDTAPFKGLRGGPSKLRQRVDFHLALATWGADGAVAGAAALAQVDKGPRPTDDPDSFWEGRAAYAVALWAQGDVQRAEAEWSLLCQPITKAQSLAMSSSPATALVNRGAQLLVDLEGSTTNFACEELKTGYIVPCDGPAISGLSGAASPCALFTADEVARRVWPSVAVDALRGFRKAQVVDGVRGPP